jgi:hypothetical protein
MDAAIHRLATPRSGTYIGRVSILAPVDHVTPASRRRYSLLLQPPRGMQHRLASRPTVYLLGQDDILPLAGFDGSCSAMLGILFP